MNTASGASTNFKTGIGMTPTTAATLADAVVAQSNTTVNAQTSYFINIKISTIFGYQSSISSYVRVTLPPEVSYMDSTGTDIIVSVSAPGVLNTPTVDKTGLTSSPSYFELKGMVTSSANYRTRGQTFLLQIDNLNNPPSIATSGSFTIGLYDPNNNLYESKSTGMTVTATAGILVEVLSPSMSATSYSVLDPVDFTMTLQSATALNPGASASIVVTFPPEFTLTPGTCILTALTGFASSS